MRWFNDEVKAHRRTLREMNLWLAGQSIAPQEAPQKPQDAITRALDPDLLKDDSITILGRDISTGEASVL